MWNYRIVKRRFASGWTAYEICEVYYDEETGDIDDWSTGIAPQGDEFEDLKADFNHMQSAFNKPVLEEIKLPNGKEVLRLLKT